MFTMKDLRVQTKKTTAKTEAKEATTPDRGCDLARVIICDCVQSIRRGDGSLG